MWRTWLILLQVIFTVLHRIKPLPFYHQNDYDVEFERTDVEWYDESYFTNVTWRVGWYNRTVKRLNLSLRLLQPLGNDITGTVQAFKMMSNEYRYFPITIGANICEEFKHNNFNIKQFLKNYSNIPECPLIPAFYYIRSNGLPLDTSKFPPFIPRGSYKAYGQVYYMKKRIASGNVYVSVKDKPIKWN